MPECAPGWLHCRCSDGYASLPTIERVCGLYNQQQALTIGRASHSPPNAWGSLRFFPNTQNLSHRALVHACGQCES